MKPSERIEEIREEFLKNSSPAAAKASEPPSAFRWAALMAYLDETLPAKETFKDAEGRTLTFTR